jgi:hypothetical protein
LPPGRIHLHRNSFFSTSWLRGPTNIHPAGCCGHPAPARFSAFCGVKRLLTLTRYKHGCGISGNPPTPRARLRGARAGIAPDSRANGAGWFKPKKRNLADFGFVRFSAGTRKAERRRPKSIRCYLHVDRRGEGCTLGPVMQTTSVMVRSPALQQFLRDSSVPRKTEDLHLVLRHDGCKR